ncbi:MAG TPA: ABC transporter substrate-binding protein [Chloroflexota bacterium]|nr:ABC transporter substrate-binding protein [Chloroflexota bacterium]
MSRARTIYALASILALLAAAVAFPDRAGAGVPALPTGTITAAFSSDFSTLDPAIGYDPFSWTGEHEIFDTLVGYTNAPGLTGTHLVPDLAAAMPKISFHGRWYTFQLRHDVRFAPPVNRLVTAADVQYSIERALAKSTNGPMFQSGFFSPLSGTAAFWSGKAKHIRGIHVINRFAIQFRLDSPDLAFLDVLTLPFAAVVPREQVARLGKHWADHVIGTGPYMLQTWQHGRQMILVRNPNYFRRGFPIEPRVVIQFGVDPHLQILRAEKSQLDLPGNEVTGTDYLALRRSSFRRQLYPVKDIGVWYIAMNMQMAPFKGNLALRRAFNMAIDKGKLFRLLNGRAILMNGILPPTMPGANQHFTYYKYNPAAARAELAKAGYKPGQLSLPMLYISNPDQDRAADAIQADLANIGVKISLKPVSSDTAYNLVYTPGKSVLTLFHWGQDYPDPSDFVDPILTCTASNNAAFYCNSTVDRLAAQARADTNTARRFATYRRIERIIMGDAPWVPLWDDIFYDFHGSRVTNFYVHPVWPFLYDQYRLKG